MRIGSLIPVLMLFFACSGDDGSDAPATDTPSETSEATADTATTAVAASLELDVAPSPHVPSVLHIQLAEPATGRAIVHYGTSPDALDRTTPAIDLSGGTLVPWIGLVAGQTVHFELELQHADGAVARSAVRSVTPPALPAGLAAVALVARTADATATYVGFSLIGPSGSFTAIVDAEGQVVWWRQAGEGQIIITPVVGRDGRSLLWGEYDQGKSEDTGTWYRVPLDGTEGTAKRLELSHHAAVELPNGNVAWLAFDFRDVTTSDGTVRRMASDRIFEGSEAGTEPYVERFNTFDDHPGPPTLTCEHMTGDFDRFDEENILEWTHGNSLAYVDSEDAFYINAKQTDWVFKIDRATGTLLWQLGGIGTGFTLADGSPAWTSAFEPTLFSHAHMSHVWEGGMVTFDNGDHRTPRVSSIAELAWDETAMTAERVWEFYHPGGQSTYPLGDVKKLDNGHYLVGWGALSQLMEVTPEHEVVWEASVPSTATIGRVFHLESLYGPEVP